MKGSWKIEKEWVAVWGLTGNEALILADILQHPEATLGEREQRTHMTKRGIMKIVKRLKGGEQSSLLIGEQSSPLGGEQSSPLGGEQSSPKKGNKVHHKKMQKVNKVHRSTPPPYNNIIIEDNNTPPTIISNTISENNNNDKGLTIVSPNDEKQKSKNENAKKAKKKYSIEEQKFHGELKEIFCEEWQKKHGEEFYWGAEAMSATIRIAAQIKFYMPEEEKEDKEKLKYNFRFFIQKIFTSGDEWIQNNATPQLINRKFNEIYTTLKNGKSNGNSGNTTHSNGISADYITRTLQEAAGIIQPK